MGSDVVIVSAYGPIARQLADSIVLLGYTVCHLVANQKTKELVPSTPGVEVIIVNPYEPNAYSEILKRADVLFDLSSELPVDIKADDDVREIIFSPIRNLLDAAHVQKVCCVIQLQSVGVLEKLSHRAVVKEYQSAIKEVSPYIRGRLLVQDYVNKLIKERNLDIRRIYSTYLAGTNVDHTYIPDELFESYKKTGRFFYPTGGISITSISAVALALLNCWLKGKTKAQYIIGGYNISYKDFFIALSNAVEQPRPFCPIPSFLLNFVWDSKQIKKFLKETAGYYRWYSSTKAVRDLGYKLPSPEQVMSEYLNNNHDEH